MFFNIVLEKIVRKAQNTEVEIKLLNLKTIKLVYIAYIDDIVC